MPGPAPDWRSSFSAQGNSGVEPSHEWPSSPDPLGSYSQKGPQYLGLHNHAVTLLVSSEPLLENDKAKQDLVIIVSSRAMLLEEFLHRRRLQVLIDMGLSIQQDVFQLAAYGASEPIVHYVYCKSPFLSLEYGLRKEFLTHFPMQPLSSSISNFESWRQPLDIFHDFLIQIGHSNLETMCHRKLVRIHEELIRQSGAYFQELKSAQLVRLVRELRQVFPAVKDLVDRK